MNGLEAYRALRLKTKDLPLHSRFCVNALDSLDLCKLNVVNLIEEGFDEGIAENVMMGLNHQSMRELGIAMGIDLNVDKNAPRLELNS